MADSKYVPMAPHPIPKEAAAYVASMSPKDKELHELAQKLLGSSYFVEWSHGYKKWVAAAAANQKQ